MPLAWELSLRLSRALKLLETAIFALLSLAESTLELPNKRPHLLPPLNFDAAESWPVDGDGEAEGEGTQTAARFSSVSVSFAGSYRHKFYYVKEFKTFAFIEQRMDAFTFFESFSVGPVSTSLFWEPSLLGS